MHARLYAVFIIILAAELAASAAEDARFAAEVDLNAEMRAQARLTDSLNTCPLKCGLLRP